MIKSEDLIFVHRQSSPESKKFSSNTDDQFVVIQVHIFFFIMFSLPRQFEKIYTYISKTKNKPCTKRNTNELNKCCTPYILNILNRLQHNIE